MEAFFLVSGALKNYLELLRCAEIRAEKVSCGWGRGTESVPGFGVIVIRAESRDSETPHCTEYLGDPSPLYLPLLSKFQCMGSWQHRRHCHENEFDEGSILASLFGITPIERTPP